ncbi:UNVERIFIED_CONTAM: E3 ubiquitin-protein ligase RMA1H1 [Sesamum radiatum]|uniref:E3 ubiquitin-protein ligase RMA n=1 Tax=Sesamum radiatum TaxID=300843 RepID=A0AAW2R380_SESRA
MDDDNLMDVDLTGLDLNREPVNLPLHRVARYGSLMNELDNTHERIEERIRQLEAVTARARQRQRWRQARNSMETSYVPSEMMVDVGERGVLNENNNREIVERTAERGKGCKRDSSHLVAKALEMDPEVKKANKEGGSFYDCNICLEEATEPILTCCGHLFCWSCFYQVPEVDSTSKECPVCKGEVSDSTVIPIYGNGGSKGVYETENGLKIPPRPKARRVESVRQQRLTQESGSGHHIRIHQVSRVLSESAASLSSLSSALSNAERLVEDLETVINSRLLRNDTRAFSVGNRFARPSNVIQSMNQPPDSTAEINAALPIGSSSQSTDVSGSIVHVMAMRTSGDINMPAPPSSSRPRRIIMSRSSDLDTRDSRESRRRRLN